MLYSCLKLYKRNKHATIELALNLADFVLDWSLNNKKPDKTKWGLPYLKLELVKQYDGG